MARPGYRGPLFFIIGLLFPLVLLANGSPPGASARCFSGFLAELPIQPIYSGAREPSADLKEFALKHGYIRTAMYRDGSAHFNWDYASMRGIPEFKPGRKALVLFREKNSGRTLEFQGTILSNAGSAANLRGTDGKIYALDLKDSDILQFWFKTDDSELNKIPPVPVKEPKVELTRPTYTRELPEVKASMQCGGTCWAHTEIYEINRLASAELGAPIEASVDYLLYKKLTDWDRFWSGTLEEGEAGFYTEFMIEKYGFIPKKSWTPRGGDGAVDRIYTASVNKVHKLREKFFELDKDIQNLKISREAKFEQSDLLRKRIFQEMKSYVDDLVGTPPASVQVQGIKYTPTELGRKALKYSSLRVSINPVFRANDADLLRTAEGLFELQRHANQAISHRIMKQLLIRNADETKNLIRMAINEGIPVQAGVRWDDAFVDLKTGKISLPPGKELTIKEGHAVQIVGYRLGPNGDIESLKILTSWGSQVGMNGYFDMDYQYFLKGAADLSIKIPERQMRTAPQ